MFPVVYWKKLFYFVANWARDIVSAHCILSFSFSFYLPVAHLVECRRALGSPSPSNPVISQSCQTWTRMVMPYVGGRGRRREETGDWRVALTQIPRALMKLKRPAASSMLAGCCCCLHRRLFTPAQTFNTARSEFTWSTWSLINGCLVRMLWCLWCQFPLDKTTNLPSGTHSHCSPRPALVQHSEG